MNSKLTSQNLLVFQQVLLLTYSFFFKSSFTYIFGILYLLVNFIIIYCYFLVFFLNKTFPMVFPSLQLSGQQILFFVALAFPSMAWATSKPFFLRWSLKQSHSVSMNFCCDSLTLMGHEISWALFCHYTIPINDIFNLYSKILPENLDVFYSTLPCQP